MDNCPITQTFMFADLRGYTEFVERRGDRAAAALISAYRELIRNRVRESAGAEIKVEGDAMFVVFPSARQAITCAVAILKGAASHTAAHPELPMRLGVGLHAGEPVSQAGDFIGSAVNVAARIGAAAGAGQLLVTDLVRGLVRTDSPYPLNDRGPVILKGLSEPIHLYEVVWAEGPSRDSAALTEGSVLPPPARPEMAGTTSPLVGRSQELATFAERVRALHRGKGGTVLVAGEAGIGKSRLLREALWGGTDSPAVVLYGACGLSDAPPPYEPFSAMVRSIIQEPDGEGALQRVAAEVLALTPELLSSRAQAPDRDHLFGALLRLIRQYTRVSTTAVVIEDLHWADEATLAAVQFLAGAAPATPFLLIATYRSDELHRRHRLRPVLAALSRLASVSTIELSPLGASESLQLLRSLSPLKSAEPRELEVIRQRSEGNPLFLEELGECHELGAQLVPSSLADSVLQRVGRAGPQAERLLRYAAVIGPRAPYDLLEQLVPEEREMLTGARSAVEQHLLVEESDALAFRHALTREAVLVDLMAREQRSLHREVGEALERRHGEEADQAGAIAEHFAAAGLYDRAVPFLLRAGERALSLHAPDEAARSFERAVEWSPAADKQRMAALEGLGRAYARVHMVKKASTTYQEALELARSLGTQEDIARLTLRRTLIMPWGREEYASWKASWEAAEPLGKPAHLARLASGIARRAHLFYEDDEAQRWIDRSLSEARRAGSRELELRALRHRNQFNHPAGWQVDEERLIREELDAALAHDRDVLDAYSDLLVRRCRESNATERATTLEEGRAYAQRRGIPLELGFQYGLVWINWLTGDWKAAEALWDEVRTRWSEDAPNIYPDAGPIAAAIELERLGPQAVRDRMHRATKPMGESQTWRGQLTAAAHEANLWLAEGHAELVLANMMPILERRPPAMLDMESYALTTRVVLPAALLTRQTLPLKMWTDDPVVAAGGAFHRASVDQAAAISAGLSGEPARAGELFGLASASQFDRGWRLLAHEMAWQWKLSGVPGADAAMEKALAFYEENGASWRLDWLRSR